MGTYETFTDLVSSRHKKHGGGRLIRYKDLVGVGGTSLNTPGLTI